MSALRPTGRPCLILVCRDDADAAEVVNRRLLEVNSVRMVTYRHAEDLLCNPPTVNAAMVILAADDSPAVIGRTLEWVRHRWSRCPVAVVGDVGCGEHEKAARQGGAFYLTRPDEAGQLSEMLVHVLGSVQARCDRLGLNAEA